MASRRSISTKLRFEIFKRDGFQCVYCGASPKQSELRIDHVVPVSMGGSDHQANLVTACFECNAGKSNIQLLDGDLLKIREEAQDMGYTVAHLARTIFSYMRQAYEARENGDQDFPIFACLGEIYRIAAHGDNIEVGRALELESYGKD